MRELATMTYKDKATYKDADHSAPERPARRPMKKIRKNEAKKGVEVE